MKTAPDLGIFSKRIELLVREHVEACRELAQAAIERALGAPPALSSTKAMASVRATLPPRPGTTGRRRTQAEMETLCEQVYAAVLGKPGATMMMLAPELGLPTTALQRPMATLKEQGRVRSVGARALTRYYPMVIEEKAAA